jgi:hypothetical protein
MDEMGAAKYTEKIGTVPNHFASKIETFKKVS